MAHRDGRRLSAGGDVDDFLQATYADPNHIEAEVVACTVRPDGTG